MTQKTLLTSFLSFVLSLLLFYPEKINAQPCIDNDECASAFELPQIVSDAGFVCIDGCNLFASPDPIINACQMGTFPTVWYHFTSDDLASTMNLSVKSSFFETPVISVFTTGTDCNNLVPVYLTNYFYPCVEYWQCSM